MSPQVKQEKPPVRAMTPREPIMAAAKVLPMMTRVIRVDAAAAAQPISASAVNA